MQQAMHYYELDGRPLKVHQVVCTVAEWARFKRKAPGKWSRSPAKDGLILACHVIVEEPMITGN